MKSLEKLKLVFDDISITPEQQQALDDFFEEFYENVEEKVRGEIQEEINESSVSDLEMISKEEALEALKLQKEEFLEDAEKAFEKATADLRNEVAEEYSERFTKALDEMYESIYDRVSKDFTKSKEGSALENVKKAIQPLIISEDNVHLIEKIQTLESKLHELNEEKHEFSRKELINNLVSDIDDESDRETVLEFVEEAKSEDEIYERFNAVMSILEKTNSKKTVVAEDVVEETAEEVINEDETNDTTEEVETVFESETSEVVDISSKRKNKFMSDLESKIVDHVFKPSRTASK